MADASSSRTMSMNEVMAEQERLREEAAEAIPFSFSSCTYAGIDEDRQPIYSCLSCRPSTSKSQDVPGSAAATEFNENDPESRAGICAACSVSCHGDCELVELFTRRNFTCDCGTSKLESRKCTLTLRQGESPSSENKYDGNFDGIFCTCKTRYDPETEEDEMIQCLFCQDWFHSSRCLGSGGDGVHPDDFDVFVCQECTIGPAKRTVARYAGRHPLFAMLDKTGELVPKPKDEVDEAERLAAGQGSESKPTSVAINSELKASAAETHDSGTWISNHGKRPSETAEDEETEEGGKKRAKLDVTTAEDSSRCSAPSGVNPMLDSGDFARKDVYLLDGWREAWCKCPAVRPPRIEEACRTPLVQEETVYEPPADPDSGKTLEELGTQALLQMPREQAIQGLQAYTSMRDKLRIFLEPFAREGKVVSREDVDRFFLEQKEAALAG